MIPCLTCGEPAPSSYCDQHTPAAWSHREGSARGRGYSTAWDKLSRRARRLQPFCSDCGATDDLQLDHTEHTWQRIEAGKVVRIKDTGGVVCGPCNVARGAARGRSETHAGGTFGGTSGPRGKAQGPSLTSMRVSTPRPGAWGEGFQGRPVPGLDNERPSATDLELHQMLPIVAGGTCEGLAVGQPDLQRFSTSLHDVRLP